MHVPIFCIPHVILKNHCLLFLLANQEIDAEFLTPSSESHMTKYICVCLRDLLHFENGLVFVETRFTVSQNFHWFTVTTERRA